ncbi:MAG: beta strand repeat-containing protein, partial [Holosporales bacterium]
NTYTGATTINAGVLSVDTLANGGSASNIGQSTNAAGNLVLGGGTLQYTGVSIATNRNFTLTASTSSTLDVTNAASVLTISGASTNTTGALTKAGAGGLTLSAANLYTGLTTVIAGTLSYGITNALSSGGITVNGGTLDIGAFNDTVGTVTLTSGTITGTTGVLTGTSYAAESGTISAILGGSGGLTKTTTGTVTLTRDNTYTGATTINGGILSVATLANGGTASGIGQSSTAAANLVLSGGTLQYTGVSIATNRNFTLTASTSSTLDVTNTASVLTISGASTATTGSLTKTGTGALVLSGANLFTGGLSVNAGTLRLGASNVLADTTALTVASGATFDLSSFNETAGSINSSGIVTLGTGNAFTTGGNQTFTGQITGGSVTLNSTGGSITANNTTNDFIGTVSLYSGGALSIIDANALTLGTVVATTVVARALAGGISTTGQVTASATTGTALELSAATNYINTAGVNALQTGAGGRWIVYSNSPGTDTRNGLVANFRQYNAPVGTAPVASGNGFLYAVAPTLTASLTGSLSKVYDGTTTFAVNAANYALSGVLSTDTITLNNPATGTVGSPNVGNGLSLTVTGVALASAVNGAETVYGYTLLSSTLTGTIAAITPASLTISTADVTKTFDGTLAASGSPLLVSGTLYGADSISGGTFAFTNSNAGIGNKTVTVNNVTVTDGNGGNNYTVSYLNNTTSSINKALLGISSANISKIFDGTLAASGSPLLVSGTLYGSDSISGGTFAFTNPNPGTGNKTVTVKDVSVNDGNSGGNYQVRYIDNTSSSITVSSEIVLVDREVSSAIRINTYSDISKIIDDVFPLNTNFDASIINSNFLSLDPAITPPAEDEYPPKS